MRSELGSIREKSKGVWEVRISLGYDKNGKYRQKSRTVRGSRKDARNALNALLAQYAQGADGDITIQDFINIAYLPWHDKEYPRKDSTAKLHYVLGRVCDDLPVVALNSLSKAFLVQWAQNHPGWMTDKLRAVLNKAVEWEYIDKSPMHGIKREACEPDRRRLTVDELRDVLAAVRGTAIEAAVIVQASCGLRKGEALALDWDDIDFNAGRLEVKRTWHYDKGSGWFEETKNANSKGWVSIPGSALERLREIRCADGIIRVGPIATCNGSRMIPNTYSSAWRRLMRPVLGEAYVPVENLRHTHGSMLFDAGVSVDFISKRLRHASTRITERHYIAADSTADDTAASVFDDVMGA